MKKLASLSLLSRCTVALKQGSLCPIPEAVPSTGKKYGMAISKPSDSTFVRF